MPEIKGRNQTAIFYFLEKRMNLGTRSSILVPSYSACLNILNGQQHYVPQFFKGDIVGPNNPLENVFISWHRGTRNDYPNDRVRLFTNQSWRSEAGNYLEVHHSHMPTHSNFEIKKQEKYFVHSCALFVALHTNKAIGYRISIYWSTIFGNIADPNEFLNKVDVRCAWIAISSAVPF